MTADKPEQTLSAEAEQAWLAYRAMSESKLVYFNFLNELDQKYDADVQPSIAENLKLEQLLKVHDRNVRENMVSIKACIHKVAFEVVRIWERASVPAKRVDKVELAIMKLWSCKDNLRKNKKKMGSLPENMQTDMTLLFDVSKANAAPEHASDVAFLEDQRGPRKQMTGGLDKKQQQQNF